jgi:hypothetical protein
MHVTIEKPIEVGKLPPEVRGAMASNALVRVSLEVLDENGFTDKEVAELDEAIKASLDPENIVGPFSGNEFIAYLDTLDNEGK